MTEILLIDDNDGLRDCLSALLRNRGYGVAEAASGKDGIKLARALGVKLVITDLIMPEMEGIETIRELRRLSPTPAVIAMSGASAASSHLGMASKLGARRTILKPFSPAVLYEAVEEILGPGSKAERSASDPASASPERSGGYCAAVPA